MAIQIQESVFTALADFIVSEPTLEQIIAYQLPDMLEQRLHDLLEKNREEGLTEEEQTEVDSFMAASHLMTLAKAKARLQQRVQS
jgi:hypothetical protein